MRIAMNTASFLEKACEDALGALRATPPIPELPPFFAFQPITFTARFTLPPPRWQEKSTSSLRRFGSLSFLRSLEPKPSSMRPVDAAEGVENPWRTIAYQRDSRCTSGSATPGQGFPPPLGKRPRGFGEKSGTPNVLPVTPDGVFHKRPQAPPEIHRRPSRRKNEKSIRLMEAVENASSLRASAESRRYSLDCWTAGRFPQAPQLAAELPRAAMPTLVQEKLHASSGMLW